MALDHIPSFLDTPGVLHDSAVMRIANYQATGGESGVGGPSHLRVTAQSTPVGTVRVSPGTFAAVSRYPNVIGESYVGRNVSSTDVAVTPTTSSGARSDAVVLRIDDLGKVGQTPPAAELQGYEYAGLHVVEGVSASLRYPGQLALPYPFVLLARIDIPSSTSAITNSMIVNLREVVNPKQELVVRTYAQLASDEVQELSSQIAYPQGQYFPRLGGSGALDNSTVHTIRTPEWATEMEIRADWLSVAMDSFAGNGHMWVTWDTVVQNSPAYRTQAFRWSSEDTKQRQNWVVVDTVPLAADYRGRDIHFALRANRDAGGSAVGRARMDTPSGLSLSVRFLERAD